MSEFCRVSKKVESNDTACDMCILFSVTSYSNLPHLGVVVLVVADAAAEELAVELPSGGHVICRTSGRHAAVVEATSAADPNLK